MTPTDFIEEINKLRRQNKGKWYTWSGYVDGKTVAIKGYETWLQIFRINGLEQGCPMDVSVGKFKELLARPFQEKSEK